MIFWNAPWFAAKILVRCLVLLPVSVFAAQTWYVSPTGNDAFPGTQLQPFRQISNALTKVHSGDIVLVADGTYRGFDVNGINGTSNAPIAIRAQGTNAIIQITTTRSDNRDTIFINDSTYVTVDGLRSFGANRAALRIQDGHHVTVRNCVFGNNATWGILTGQSPDLLIENNECYGSVDQHGIYVANSADRPVVRRNRCYDNHGSGIQLNADVNTPPGDGIITDALIEQNIIYNNGGNNGGGGGLNLDGVQNSIIRNNLLFTNHASGIILFMIDGAEGPRGNQILNNTIDMAPDGRWALGLKQTSGSNYVRNNILYNRNTGRGGLEFGSTNDAARTDSDYNVLNHITPDDGDTRLTLAQWQAQGKDLHSVTGSLAGVFIDANIGNYLLRTNSTALNAAQTSTNVTNDFDGNPRPSGPAPDVGCFELSPFALRILRSSNSVFQLNVSGGAGKTYQIESASALIGWSPMMTWVRSNQTMALTVSNQGAQRFYRANYTW
jgi:hypothetical protein